MIDTSVILHYSIQATMTMMAISLMLVLIRVFRGPSLPDRVIGLDVLNSVIVGVVAVDAVATGESSFLPAALVLSLLAFLATVAFAFHLSRRPEDE